MASDAMLPEPAPAAVPEDDGTTMPSDARQRGRRRRQRSSFVAMIRAELALMLFMAGLGLWICLIALSIVFPFGAVVSDMDRAGIFVTTLAVLSMALIAFAVPSLTHESGWRGAIIPVVLIGAMACNWLGWMFHFNVVVQIKQLLF